MKMSLSLVVAGALLCNLISCSSTSHKKKVLNMPRSETLYLGGLQWGSPDTFNPLDWWSAFPVMGGANNNIMYEHLLKFNALNSKIEPFLSKIHEETPDSIAVLMNPLAKWSDGVPLTSKDVLFTYELSKHYEGVPSSYVWEYLTDIRVDTIQDPDDTTISVERINFVMTGAKRRSPSSVLGMLQSVRIVPKHDYTARLKKLDNNFAELQCDPMNDNPVISGPYQLHDFTNERIVLKRRDDYWGNKGLYTEKYWKERNLPYSKQPVPEYIIHPILKSNGHWTLALQKAMIDMSSCYIPRIKSKQAHGVGTWFKDEPYYVAGSIPMITFNVTKAPLNDKALRRAIAFGINYRDVAVLGVSGYSDDLQAGLVLPFGAEKQYFSAEDVKNHGAHFDTERAKKILADAGYKSVYKDERLDHMLNAKGEKVPTITIMSPAGWTDWEAIVRLVVRDLRAIGIDARENLIDEGMYWTLPPNGEFSILMQTPAAELGPTTPLSRFEACMSSREWAPIGEYASENYGRYNNPDGKDYKPEVDSLINVIPTILNDEERIVAYRRLNVIFMEDQPSVPLVYRPEQFYQFNEKYWGNYPTSENPYCPPQMPTVGAARDILWQLTKTGKGE